MTNRQKIKFDTGLVKKLRKLQSTLLEVITDKKTNTCKSSSISILNIVIISYLNKLSGAWSIPSCFTTFHFG